MFKLVKFLVTLGLGGYLGMQVSATTMRMECSTLDGTWTENVCVVKDSPQ